MHVKLFSTSADVYLTITCIAPTFSYDKKPAGTFSYPRNPEGTFSYPEKKAEGTFSYCDANTLIIFV